ncbi:hypothetical protein B566_EDAN005889 [Ephemera danica]|nr:hypothetical protein B566_EDAN005889 [Ephemera danica]
MESFCGSEFWAQQDDIPGPFYFTTCFERTALAWSPCVFLWIFLPMEVHYLRSSVYRNIPRTWFNISKFLGALLICLSYLSDLIYALSLQSYGETMYAVDFTTPAIQATTYLVVTVLIEANRERGMRTSGLLFLFWFVAVLFGAPRFLHFANELFYHNDTFETSFLFYTCVITYLLTIVELCLHCPADEAPQHCELSVNKKTCPERQSSFLSRLTYTWFDTVTWLGYKRPLEAADLWEMYPKEKSEFLVPLFDKFWQRSLEKKAKKVQKDGKTQPASILPAIWKAFGPTFLFGSFLKVISDVTGFFNPVLLHLLIGFVWSDAPLWEGYLWAVLLFANVSMTTFILSQYFQRMFVVGLRIRASLISAIFRKALRLSSTTRRDTTVGEIVNLMSADAQRFMDLIPYVNMIWSNPLQFSLCFYLLWIKLGVSVLSGLAVLLLLLPVDAVIAGRMRSQQIRQMQHKDKRVRLMNEILAGIKVLKLYAWELFFEQKVNDIREAEVKELRKTAYYDATNSFIWNFAPILVSLVSFATFVLSSDENILDAQTAFVSLTLFNMMRYSLTMFPVMITSLVQLSVAIKRINKFMNLEELDPTCVSRNHKEVFPLVIENGTFSWGEGPEVLNDVTIRVKPGTLVAVVGAVGCGKSSLLSAIIGDMHKLGGRVNVTGSIAYVPQQAWIQNTSLKENILFSNHLDQDAYERVLKACALKPDIKILPAGDETEIGEKGINLSGGQKQRVSLARAAYSKREIYLLDDPLSAVDSRVAKHLFEHVIGPRGLLKEKTRVLVTHGVTHLHEADVVVVMENGYVTEMGTYAELIARGGAFANLVSQHLHERNDEEDDQQQSDDEEKENEKGEDSELIAKSKESKLIEAEKAETGKVSWSVYGHYLGAVGVSLWVTTLVFSAAQQLSAVLSNVWLAYWSNQQTNTTEPLTPEETNFFLGIYGAFGLLQAILVLIPTITLVLAGVRAAIYLHNLMLVHTLRNPISFFDTTPMGRVVNRFAKDVDVVDNTLPVNIRTWLSSFLLVVATLLVISITNYYFICAIIPIGILYFVIQRFYIPTSRQLRRLESVSRSPIYSHFGESLTGTSSIRAYACERRFEKESEMKVDTNQMPYYLSIIANRWLAIRLEMLGNLIIFSAALLAVIGRDTMNPGTVGLSISYALQITATLNFLVRTTSDLETNVVAVERIKEYCETPEEPEWDIQETKPKSDWPTEGKIDFKNFEMKYREGLDLVLNDITCSVNAGEKVGLVGRTGAGKSSLALGLFRIIESCSGKILIDSVDISTLGLHNLRSRLTIIPQDPVLFAGTLRSNVDPLDAHDDAAVWRALELAHLDTAVRAQPAGLAMELGEGGEGLSSGQRQLVCLARALLRKTKILVLDEATGAIDLQTDDLIQKTIRDEFKDCTVLTIAHRLNTIMDSDRVLVLENGRLVETGSPDDLLRTQGSRFRAMARDAGLAQ